MPAKIIGENQDYYDEMISDEHFTDYMVGSGTQFTEQLYDTMSTTEEGRARFQKNFAEKDILQNQTRDLVNELINDQREPDESETRFLKLAKACGTNLLAISSIPHIRNMNAAGYAKNKTALATFLEGINA